MEIKDDQDDPDYDKITHDWDDYKRVTWTWETVNKMIPRGSGFKTLGYEFNGIKITKASIRFILRAVHIYYVAGGVDYEDPNFDEEEDEVDEIMLGMAND